ncbi:MAG: HAD-IA family hydrolase [Paracoccaceae bacterium]|nr:HAD-IA family hydrolase [Paracoccaceae bacterium]
MTRCLMLDVDGVVVTGRPSDGLSWATDIERDLGIDFDKLAKGFFAPHWDDVVLGRRDLRTVLDASLPDIAPDVTADVLIDYWFAMDARVDQDVLTQVDALRTLGQKVILATNQEHLRARYLMQEMGLARYVDGIVYSAAIGARKPQKAFFNACAAHANAIPTNLILVDDTAANVAAAQGAGWRAHLWTGEQDLIALVTKP